MKEESISPQEKEKLRKKLQKLFQKEQQHNDSESSSAGKSQMKGARKLQFKKDKVKFASPKNSNNKQQQNQKNFSSSIENTTTKQNGFVNSNKDLKNTSLHGQKNVKEPQQNGFVESHVKTKKPNKKMENTQNSSKQQAGNKETNSIKLKNNPKENGAVQQNANLKTLKSNENSQKTKPSNSSSKQLDENKKINSNITQKPLQKKEGETKQLEKKTEKIGGNKKINSNTMQKPFQKKEGETKQLEKKEEQLGENKKINSNTMQKPFQKTKGETKQLEKKAQQLVENKKTNSNTKQTPFQKNAGETKNLINNKQNEHKSSIPPKNKNQKQKQTKHFEKKQPSENVTKTPTKTTVNNTDSNKQATNQHKNQKKSPQKRTAPPPDTTSQHTATAPTINKKPKLSNQADNKKDNFKKSNKKNNKKANRNNSTLKLQENENEFDLNKMTGCVRGGDFDSDYEEHPEEQKYWMQQQNSSSDEDSQEEKPNVSTSTSISKNKTKIEKKSKQNINTELEHYKKDIDTTENESNMYSDDEEHEFNDSYFFNDSDEYDEEDEGEEEYESYSDFDEDVYEEDEDSYDYSDDEFSTNYEEEEDDEYDFNYHHDSDEDDDYELPNDVPEDLIIHRGTATKREIKPEDNVSFNSENEDAQIIELEDQDIVKEIKQPKAYDKEELMKLKYKENSNTPKPISFHKKERIYTKPNDTALTTTTTTATNKEAEDDDCPKLVPIIDEDGFQLYNPNEESQDEQDMEDEEQNYEFDSMEEYDDDDDEDENMDEISLGSEYEEINSDDADSIISEDINEKYLNKTQTDYNSDVESIDEDVWNRKHKADIIDATACKYEKKKNKKEIDNDSILNDDIKQLPSMKLFEKVNLKTASSILSTTIMDKKHFKINEMEEDKETFSKIDDKNHKSIKVTEISEKETLEKDSIKETVNENEQQFLAASQQDNAMEDIEQEQHIESVNVQVKVVKPQSLSDYQTKFFNAFDSNLVLVLLKEPFYIYGTVRLTLLAGNLQIYGHNLELNTEVELFSPRGCSVIEISPSTNKNPKENLEDLLKPYEKHFALADLKTIKDNFNSQTNAILLLKRNEIRKKLVQQFKKFMNENVFPNLNNINMDRPLYNTEYLLRCLINTNSQEQKCLKIPQQWQNLQVNINSRIMLAGGKSVGKSTLIRYLINRHLPQLNRILLIDLDIGQPEVFIPQTVSCTQIKQPLLGPGFMLNLQPEIAFAVGHTNIALCPYKYLKAVRNLLSYCKSQKEFQEIPWLINTMGYNKGFGLELLSVIAQELPLTDLIQLQSNKDINNFDSILHTHVLEKVPRLMFSSESEENIKQLKYRLHVWQSAVEQESRYQKEWEMSAKDMRFAILLARLSEALQGHAEWLTDIKPLSASLNDLKIVNLLDNNPQLSAEELAKAVEANLVYLCHYQDDNEPLKCFGIGVVRAVDLHIRQVYLIPAVQHSLLKDVNCIALGEMPLPTSLFTNQGSKVKNIAPFVYNTVADNASKAIKQIYHRPRKFLSGKHKSLD